METWFERINQYASSLGFEIEHYVISSGMSEMITNSLIAGEFKKIYACRYTYDENGYAKWPAQIINMTTKTQFLYRINKGKLDETDDVGLNDYMPEKDRPIPFRRMIYVADGETDIPCMQLVKSNGGNSIAVYNENSGDAGITAQKLKNEGRANYLCKANYEKDGPLEDLVKIIIDNIYTEEMLLDLQLK